jgi:hypothetical protein
MLGLVSPLVNTSYEYLIAFLRCCQRPRCGANSGERFSEAGWSGSFRSRSSATRGFRSQGSHRELTGVGFPAIIPLPKSGVRAEQQEKEPCDADGRPTPGRTHVCHRCRKRGRDGSSARAGSTPHLPSGRAPAGASRRRSPAAGPRSSVWTGRMGPGPGRWPIPTSRSWASTSVAG